MLMLMSWQNKYLQSTGMFAQCEAVPKLAKLLKVNVNVAAFAGLRLHVCMFAVAVALAENRLQNTGVSP